MLVAAAEQGRVRERAFPRWRRKDERWSKRSGLSMTQCSREAPALDSEERPMGSTIQGFLKALEAAERWMGEEYVERNWNPQGYTPIKNVTMEEGKGGVPRGLSRVAQTFPRWRPGRRPQRWEDPERGRGQRAGPRRKGGQGRPVQQRVDG